MATVIKKERMVTRTIIRNTVTVKGYNWDEEKKEERTKTITGKLDKFEDEMFILQAFNSTQFIPREIVSVESKEIRYGMSENDFIKYGHILKDDEGEIED